LIERSINKRYDCIVKLLQQGVEEAKSYF